MLTGLLGILGVIPAALHSVDNLTNAIANEKIAALTAQTDQERIQSGERIAVLQARRDALIALASRSPWPARIAAMIAIGPTYILNKIIFWDKGIGPFFGCVGHTDPGECMIFTTDPLDAHIWYVIGVVLSFYLLADAYKGK